MKSKQSSKLQKWRKAVRDAMYEATLQEIKNSHKPANVSFNYRWEHVSTVTTLAVRLARLTGADVDIVEAAAWLHDVCKSSGESHAVEGAKFARKLLPKTNFPKKKIAAVAQAIESHKGLYRRTPLKNLEAMVLWDADKLSKIGLTAVFHWTGGALAGTKSVTIAEIIARGRQANWQAKTVASMHTKPAQRAAKKRLKAYNKLWDKLEAELNGDDLE